MTVSTSPYDHARLIEQHQKRISELEGVLESQGNLIQLLIDKAFPDGVPLPQTVEDGEELEGGTPDTPEAFNPSEHTVEEVTAYLTEQGPEGQAEIDRVLAAERSGKKRKALVGDVE